MNPLKEIIASAKSLAQVSTGSAAADEVAQEKLRHRVNKKILQHPDIERLLGDNSPELLE